MKTTPTHLISALSLSFLNLASHAAELKTIEVTATTPLPPYLQESNQEFNQGNSETGALLRQFSGVEAQRLGGHGLDILIRGQGQNAVNILIDQGKIEGACPNRMDSPTAYAELASFDKVTLIKGVKSLQYGTGGTAGTVLLERTKPEFSPAKPYQGKVYAGANSNGLNHDIGAEVATGNDQIYLVMQASNKNASHYKDGKGNKVKSAYKTQQGHFDLGWTPSEQHHLKLSHEISNTTDAHYQGAMMDAPKSDGTMTRLSYQGKDFLGVINKLEFNLYHSEVKHLMDNYSLRPAGMMQMQTPSKATAQGAKVKLTSNLGQTEIDYGVILQKAEKNALLKNKAGNSQWYMWPNAQTQQNSIFIEANSPISAKQTLIYGIRLDRATAEAKDAKSSTQAGNTPWNSYQVRNTNYSGRTKITETNWNGLIRLEQDLTDSLQTFVGISYTQRTADETERFMARNNWTGNPDLKPEKHLQADLGFSQTSSNYNLSANIYYDQINDFILRTPSSTYQNIDAAIYGAELDWQTSYQAWTFAGNFALTQGRNKTDKRNLQDMSPLNGSFNIRYDSAKWYAGTQFNFALKQNKIDSLAGEDESPSWATFNIFAGYQITRDLLIQAGIENLLDKDYFTHVNRKDALDGSNYKVIEPGRNLWIKAHLTF